MTKTSILDQEEYVQLFIYIYKNKEVKATSITKNLNYKSKDRRLFSMKIQEMKKKNFIKTEGYGKYASYSIDKEGVFNYWTRNFLPQAVSGHFMSTVASMEQKESRKTINALIDNLFKHILVSCLPSQKIDPKEIPKEKRPENEELYTIPHGTLTEAFNLLRDNFLLDGLIYFTKRKTLIPFN